jgi:hypothetical protein
VIRTRVKMFVRPTPAAERTPFNRWTLGIYYPGRPYEELHYAIKLTGMLAARLRAHHYVVDDDAKVSLYICGADGKFQEERTYPRAADPRETPG